MLQIQEMSYSRNAQQIVVDITAVPTEEEETLWGQPLPVYVLLEP